MDAQQYRRLAESVMMQQDEMRSEWDWLARRILPRSRDVLHQLKAPPSKRKREHSAAACEALYTLVGAFMAHVTPTGQRWFEFSSPSAADGAPKHEAWYRNATDVTLRYLAGSNFYPVIQEAHMDRCLFGTCCVLCEASRSGKLMFRHIPVGAFGVAENADGVIDTVCRSFRFTAHQAVEQWGYGALPPEVQRAFDDERSRFTQQFEFWHLVTPRQGFVEDNGLPDADPMRMRWASVYMYGSGDFRVIEEGGYPEFPFLVSRFLHWGDTVWGYPPGRKCREELDGIVRTERNLDVLGDLAAFPRMFIDAEQDGDVDFRAGGLTVIDRQIAGLNLPREWGSQGRYDVGLDRLERMESKVRSAFFVPFLQVVSSVDRGMTATEVVARQQEQVLGICATFGQFMADFSVLIERIFAVLFRSGAYNTARGTQPAELMVVAPDGQNFAVRVPDVAYLGKISQAIQISQKQSLDYALQSAAQYVQMTGDQTALDCVDVSQAVRFAFKTLGAPSEVFRSAEDVERIRAQRQQAEMMAMAAQEADAMQMQTQAARNLRQ